MTLDWLAATSWRTWVALSLIGACGLGIAWLLWRDIRADLAYWRRHQPLRDPGPTLDDLNAADGDGRR